MFRMPPSPSDQPRHSQPDYQPPTRTRKMVGSTIIIVIGVSGLLIVAGIIPLRAPTGPENFTGVKIFASPYVTWSGHYWVGNETSSYHVPIDGQGNREIALDCPSGHRMGVIIKKMDRYGYGYTLETWVRGEPYESKTVPSFFSLELVSVSANC